MVVSDASNDSNSTPPQIPFLARLTGGLAWHYTNTSGLLGIFDSGRLWASSLQSLNDMSEGKHGLEVVRRAWGTIKNAPLPEGFFDCISNALDEEAMAEVRKSVFLISASTHPDSLNQWMHYSGSDGFAIGLGLDAVWRPVQKFGATQPPPLFGTHLREGWYEVIYDQSAQDQLAEDVLKWLADNWRTLPDTKSSTNKEAGVASARHIINSIVFLLKHPAFSDEREVRYVCAISEKEAHAVSYRAVGNRVVSYLPVACIPEVAPLGQPLGLQIDAVKCGPGISLKDVEIIRDRVQRTANYPVVTQSEIPLRPRA